MKRTRLLAIVLAGGLAIAACGGGDDDSGGNGDDSAAPSAEEGKQLFGSTCASCHGQDAKGMPDLGKDLTTSAWVAEQTDADLLAFLKVGRPASDPLNTTGVDMPPKGGNPSFTDSDLESIVAYVRSINNA
ncbi:MAG: c-type cytochrome [Acidimicrobiia bacterium]|nr:c-type cytochrome [Acidimicrobiia bacterium]